MYSYIVASRKTAGQFEATYTTYLDASLIYFRILHLVGRKILVVKFV